MELELKLVLDAYFLRSLLKLATNIMIKTFIDTNTA